MKELKYKLSNHPGDNPRRICHRQCLAPGLAFIICRINTRWVEFNLSKINVCRNSEIIVTATVYKVYEFSINKGNAVLSY